MRLYVYILVLLSIFAHANNAELEQILNENSETITESEQSQDTIDDLQLEKDSLLKISKTSITRQEWLTLVRLEGMDQNISLTLQKSETLLDSFTPKTT